MTDKPTSYAMTFCVAPQMGYAHPMALLVELQFVYQVFRLVGYQ